MEGPSTLVPDTTNEDTSMMDPENQTTTSMGPGAGSTSIWNVTSKKGLIILSIVYFFLLASVVTAIAVGTYYALQPEEADKFVFTNTETKNKAVNATVTTNGTFVNETVTIFVNGTFVNQTVTVFINGTCLNDTTVVDNNGTMLNQTITLCTNGTFVNQTQSIFINGSYKNVTRQRFVNGTTMIVTMNVTEIVELEYLWYDGGNWQYALNGADVVEYFSISASANAVAGNDAYVSEAFGVQWRFKDQTNKDLFDADPAKYVPAYGGYCAFAMASGALAPGDPNAWTVHKGILYINLSARVRSTWSGDKDGNIAKADPKWASLEYDNPN